MPILEKNEIAHYEENGLLAITLIGSKLMSKFMCGRSQQLLGYLHFVWGLKSKEKLTHDKKQVHVKIDNLKKKMELLTI